MDGWRHGLVTVSGWPRLTLPSAGLEPEPVAGTRECHTAPAHSVLSLGALIESSSPSLISTAAETLCFTGPGSVFLADDSGRPQAPKCN